MGELNEKRGFTLIELLVVIAIIAILAAILFPVFSTARETAKKATCQNNVKMILNAATMYENDSGAILPGWVDYNKNGSPWAVVADNNEHWPALVDPYLKQLKKGANGPEMEGVFACPSSPVSKVKTTNKLLSGSLRRTYGYNWAYLGGYNQEFHKAGEVAKPTKTIRILENWRFDSGAFDAYTKGCGSEYCYPPYKIASYCAPDQTWPPGWHGGHSVVGWFDGHVSTAKLPEPQITTHNYYVGIMDQGPNTGRDPYFRLALPKP